MKNKIIQGDCIKQMKKLEDESIDTILTDPPYGLEFMGSEWDSFKDKGDSDLLHDTTKDKNGGIPGTGFKVLPRYKPDKNNLGLQKFSYMWSKEALRIAKPGSIMLCFGGTRTFHRIACGIEDAGWEIRDTLMWVYGSGFPKSHNIGKAVDKKLGNEREKGKLKYKSGDHSDGVVSGGKKNSGVFDSKEKEIYATKGNSKWEGYGTALKPAYEPILMAMKPREGTYAENALKHDVAGLNIDGGRIESDEVLSAEYGQPSGSGCYNWNKEKKKTERTGKTNTKGRFPANLIHDGSKEATKDMGDKSRYFYCAKASKKERNKGLAETQEPSKRPSGVAYNEHSGVHSEKKKGNHHPTVKPLALMEYLVKLTKMPSKDQIYLDPFVGSGTTAMAVKKKGRNYIGIEQSEEYCKIARARIKSIQKTLI